MELTFREPVIINIPDYDKEGKKIDRKIELIPLSVEEMKLTVGFEELQEELTKINDEYEGLKKEYNKAKKKAKKSKTKGITKKEKDMLNIIKSKSIERQKFIIEELLPAINTITENGMVDFETQEPVTIPKRYKTLPKLMQISMMILDVTTESEFNEDVDINFQMEEQQKTSSS